MKIRTNTKPRGSVLVVSLVTVTIILTALASYLALVSNENRAVARSQEWNTCIPVMEAGVDEALTQIHYCGVTSLSSNNWTLGTDGYYHKTRTIGTDGSYCKVTIIPTNSPIIYSEAYVPAPVSYQNTYYTSSNFVVREIRVATQNVGTWGGGLTAKSTITFNGNALFDSYNSANGAYSTATGNALGTNAVALTDDSAAGAITLHGNDKIYGTAVTGPGSGTVTTAVTTTGNASVGSAAWNASGGSGSPDVQPGWSANDANFQFNDVAAPYTSGTLPTSGTYGGILGLLGTTYTYLLNGSVSSQYYLNSDMTVNNGTMLVTGGNITLYVTGNVNFNGTITIASGSSLTLYVGGSFSVSGNGVVNQSGIPANFAVNGLPTCTSVSYSGNAVFIGTVDAPEAAFQDAGNADTYGAVIASSITINGNGSVHFDTSLQNQGGYAVASWNEITPQ